MTATEVDWTTHARDLADTLWNSDDIQSPAWYAAVAATPRHLFVPHVYDQDHTTGLWHGRDTADDLDRVYTPTTLVTAVEDRDGHQLPISSSTTPALMLRMLEQLDVHDDMRVLEIGTGTGYNAALLSHRLGHEHVFSIDVEPDLVGLARGRLASIGHTPTVTAVDGAFGLPDRRPFDRIIATCSVPSVPYAWIGQLTDDGAILVDVRPAVSAGNLAYLHRHGDGLRGRFLPRPASFMAMRHRNRVMTRNQVRTHRPPEPSGRPSRSTTRLAEPWNQGVPWLLAAIRLPANPTYGRIWRDSGAWWTLNVDDGSRVEVADDPVDGQREVIQSGPCQIWDEIEQAFAEWEELGQPSWDRFGLTVTPERQWIWLDDPHSEPVGELPVPPGA